eukprot:359519-Chlamydomonas_euryale.AAC.6
MTTFCRPGWKSPTSSICFTLMIGPVGTLGSDAPAFLLFLLDTSSGPPLDVPLLRLRPNSSSNTSACAEVPVAQILHKGTGHKNEYVWGGEGSISTGFVEEGGIRTGFVEDRSIWTGGKGRVSEAAAIGCRGRCGSGCGSNHAAGSGSNCAPRSRDLQRRFSSKREVSKIVLVAAALQQQKGGGVAAVAANLCGVQLLLVLRLRFSVQFIVAFFLGGRRRRRDRVA